MWTCRKCKYWEDERHGCWWSSYRRMGTMELLAVQVLGCAHRKPWRTA